MKTVTDIPRIYVACLASYNAGILHGEWIDLDEAKRVMENNIGCYSSLEDYAQELTEETTQIPENLSFSSITKPWRGI